MAATGVSSRLVSVDAPRRLRSSVAATLHVAGARLRARPGRTGLLLVGVAAAAAMLVGVFGGSLIARERALQRALAQLPPAERTFHVDLVGLPSEQPYARMDRAASSALSRLSPRHPLRVGFFRDFWLDGEFIRLVGIDRLRNHVRLRSGRLPRSCRPDACEVLQIGEQGRRVLDEGGIHLVRVGTADLRDATAFGAAFEHLSQYRAQASLVRSTVLLPRDSSSLERLPALQLLQRARSWIAPIDPSAIHSWRIDGLLEGEPRAQTVLAQADPSFTLSGPDTALLDARDRGRISAQRMVLIGGWASALLLGFAMVAAVGLRRSLAKERQRLFQRGATRAQVWLAALAEIGAVTLGGWIVGIAAGVLAVSVLAGSLGLPAGAVLAHSLSQARTLLLLVAAWLAATVLVVAVVLLRDEEEGRRRWRPRVLDVAALGAVLAAVVGLTRGGLTPDGIASRGDRTLLLLLPGLLCLIAGVAAARLLGPLARLGARLSRRSPTALRLALLALGRAPARTALAGAFLVVSIGLALFAVTYRATLERGARDEAGFAVPLDVTLTEGVRLVQPLDASSIGGYEHLAPTVRADPVLRRSADVPGQGTSGEGVTVLGIPAHALEHMYWRSDFAHVSRSTLARALTRDGPAALRGFVLPTTAVALRTRVRLSGTPIRLSAALQDASGQIVFVSLGRIDRGKRTLTAPLRARPGPLKLVGLEVDLPTNERNWFFNLANHGRAVRAPAGSLTLGPLIGVDSRAHIRTRLDLRSWVAHGGGTLRAAGRDARLSYAFPDVRTIVVRPREPTDGRPLRIIASPDVARAAGPGGLLTLDFLEPPLRARVVGIATRFPTLQPGEPFAIAEESGLATALDADAPGTGRPNELWLAAPTDSLHKVESALARPPFAALTRTTRQQTLQTLDADPMARAIEYTLGIAALLSLALAVIGFWVTLLSDLRDERGTFFDLEAQGVAPQTLRWHLRIRSLGLLTFGLLGGIVLGIVLARLVVSLIQVSAETGSPQPPLVFSPGWLVSGFVLAIFALAATAVGEASALHAFRGSTPERALPGLE
jgi:FtsX-like permease family